MKTALEIKRNVKKNVKKDILKMNPTLKSLESLPEDAREKIDELIYEYSSLALDIQQVVMNSDKINLIQDKHIDVSI